MSLVSTLIDFLYTIRRLRKYPNMDSDISTDIQWADDAIDALYKNRHVYTWPGSVDPDERLHEIMERLFPPVSAINRSSPFEQRCNLYMAIVYDEYDMSFIDMHNDITVAQIATRVSYMEESFLNATPHGCSVSLFYCAFKRLEYAFRRDNEEYWEMSDYYTFVRTIYAANIDNVLGSNEADPYIILSSVKSTIVPDGDTDQDVALRTELLRLYAIGFVLKIFHRPTRHEICWFLPGSVDEFIAVLCAPNKYEINLTPEAPNTWSIDYVLREINSIIDSSPNRSLLDKEGPKLLINYICDIYSKGGSDVDACDIRNFLSHYACVKEVSPPPHSYFPGLNKEIYSTIRKAYVEE